MAEPHDQGGARPGAGRPSNAERYSDRLTGFTDAAADYLPTAFENLERLAECPERVELEHQAAGTIFRKDVVRKADGTPFLDAKGKPVPIMVCAFPELPPDHMVLVKRKVVQLPPDFKANELFVERIGGKARPMPEPDEEGLDLAQALDQADADIAAFVEPDDGPVESPTPDDEDGGP